MTKSLPIATVLILLVFLIVFQHLIHSADFLARYTGYFVSVGVLPFSIGMCAGIIYLKSLGAQTAKESLARKTAIAVGFGLAAVIPTVYTMLMLLRDGG